MSIVWFGGAYSGGAASAVDWDTYENGIWQESPVHQTNTFYSTNNHSSIGAKELKSPTVNASTWGDYVRTWWSYSYAPTAQMNSGYTIADADPYLAVWDCAEGSWLGVAPLLEDSYGRISYSTSSNTNFKLFYQNLSSVGNTCIFVPLTEDPGDISGWRDYDGPDDWDTWEDGIAAIDMDPISGINSYFYPKNVKDSTNYEVPLRARANSYTEFQINKFDNSINGGALQNPPPYIALWWERTGSQVVRTWFVAKLKDGSVNTYEFVEAANGQATFHAGSGPTGQFAIVNLSRKPNDLANWRDYDGPLFASWDEPQRWTTVVMEDISGGSVNGVEVSYYEENSTFWTDVSSSGTVEMVPRSAFASNTGYPVQISDGQGGLFNHDEFNSLVPDARLWRSGSYSNPYNGWAFDDGPYYTGIRNRIGWKFDNAQYNNFRSETPKVAVFFKEEVGDTRHWPAYDGPVANWDTYANGVYIMDRLATDQPPLIAVPSYSATTYSYAMDESLRTLIGEGVRTNYNTVAQNTDSPPYIAVYINEYHNTNAAGWYVFERPAIPESNSAMTYTPYAWPGDVSDGSYSGNEDGYLSSAGDDTSGYIVVFLDEYNDPVGSGGTDHWTKPPIVIYGTVNNVDTASDRVDSNDLKRYGQAPGVDVYSINQTRIDSNNVDGQWIVSAESPALGVLDTQVFLNGTKISEAPWTHSGQGTGSPRVPIDFSTTGIYSDWNDFETNSGITAGDELMLVIYND